MTHFKTLILAAAASLATCLPEARAEVDIHTSLGIDLNAGSGTFAPYYIASNRHGTLTQSKGAQLNFLAIKPLEHQSRFSWGFGVEAWGGMASDTDYARFTPSTQTWAASECHPPRIWMQQLYAEVKYRGVFLTAGLKEHGSALLNQRLSSGDLIESGNARPIPEVRIGFIDFQNIPFTDGWLQIQGEIAYGKCLDNGWQKEHYSYYRSHLNLGGWYNYKRCFFRTKPSQPFSVTVGLQAAAQFAGTTYRYDRFGHCTQVDRMDFKPIDLVDMLIIRQGDSYWKGNHVGAWDFNARLRLNSGHQFKAYFQWLWEDGSGIGKLNGWDGLWGLEWQAPAPAPVSGVVIEALTFMNQSGPLHYDPDDISGTTLVTSGHADGADNYYNNTWYNGYAYYGMGIGSPMFPAPIYNTDGYTTAYVDNRFWGIHAALTGTIVQGVDYRLMGSYRRFFGTHFVPRIDPVHCTAAMLEVTWRPADLHGLELCTQLALNSGDSQLGRGFGAMLSARYSGIIHCKSKKFTPCAINY